MVESRSSGRASAVGPPWDSTIRGGRSSTGAVDVGIGRRVVPAVHRAQSLSQVTACGDRDPRRVQRAPPELRIGRQVRVVRSQRPAGSARSGEPSTAPAGPPSLDPRRRSTRRPAASSLRDRDLTGREIQPTHRSRRRSTIRRPANRAIVRRTRRGGCAAATAVRRSPPSRGTAPVCLRSVPGVEVPPAGPLGEEDQLPVGRPAGQSAASDGPPATCYARRPASSGPARVVRP